jgi:hypothetical protein
VAGLGVDAIGVVPRHAGQTHGESLARVRINGIAVQSDTQPVTAQQLVTAAAGHAHQTLMAPSRRECQDH